MSKRWPGEWTIENSQSDLIVWAGDKLVAYFPKGNFLDEVNRAHAMLTAAAPDLLAACKLARAFGSQGDTPDGISVSFLMDKAIAKAEGS